MKKKKWIEIDEVIRDTDLDIDLYEYDSIMKEPPNWDKSDGGHKVYQRKQYMILKMKRGYVIYNINRPFEEAHTHVSGFNMAKTIIDNCIKRKQPKTTNLYLLKSHARITDDEKYKQLIEELIEAKKSKERQVYRNRGK